jgi:hypothetical protein
MLVHKAGAFSLYRFWEIEDAVDDWFSEPSSAFISLREWLGLSEQDYLTTLNRLGLTPNKSSR